MINHNSFGGYDSGYVNGYNKALKDMRTVIEDIKAEIQNIYVGYRQGYEIMADVLAVFDNHISGKADEKPREYCGDDEHCRTCKYRFYTPKNDIVCLNCHGGESYQPDEKCADISGKEYENDDE